MPRPRHHLERTRVAPPPSPVRGLLPSVAPSPLPRQGRPDPSGDAATERRSDRPDPRGRRPSPSLRTARGLNTPAHHLTRNLGMAPAIVCPRLAWIGESGAATPTPRLPVHACGPLRTRCSTPHRPIEFLVATGGQSSFCHIRWDGSWPSSVPSADCARPRVLPCRLRCDGPSHRAICRAELSAGVWSAACNNLQRVPKQASARCLGRP